MKKSTFFLAASLLFPFAMTAQDYEDDIYYDGRKAEKQQEARREARQQQYGYVWQPSIEAERDVDEYNRYGAYYTTPADTIGLGIASSEDFVYTQQIQKYYNPTIVVDNQEVLADVLANSYGNVNIVYNAWDPAFDTWAYVPYSVTWGNPWYGLSVGWGWGGWYSPWYASWSPWYDYGWGWGWGWGPSWGWTYPGHCHGHWAYRDYHSRPSMGVRPGWSAGSRPSAGRPSSTRPGYAGGGTLSRPGNVGGGSGRPGSGVNSRPGVAARPSGGNLRPGAGNVRPGVSGGYTYDYRKGTLNSGNAVRRDNGGYVNGASSGTRVMRGTGGGTTSRPGNSTGTYNPGGTNSRSTQGYRPGGSTNSRPGNSGTGTTNYRTSTPRNNSGSFRSGGGSSHSSGGFRSGGGGGRASGGRR